MGIREYARHRGVRLSTVQAAVAAGRIPAVKVKGKPKIDWRKADKSWSDNTDPSKQNRKAKGVKGEAEGSGNFAAARAVRETYNAKLMQLKFESQAGEVVSVAKMKAEWFRIARTVRDALMGAPDRLCGRAAAIPDGPDRDAKLNAIWTEEIRSILEELTNAETRNAFAGSDEAEKTED